MMTADAHLDLAFDLEKQRAYGKTKVLERDYLPGFRAGGVGLVVSSLFVENMFVPEMALRMALRQVSALKADIAECPEFEFCVTYAQVEEAQARGRIAVMLSFEDCIPLYNDLTLLPLFHELGVRMMGLSWSRRNFACDGSSFSPVDMGTPGGLTQFGVELVKECGRLGMLVDVSHLNERGFWDVAERVDGPFIASHSNAAALMPTQRNLSDDQIREIVARRGYIGINAMNFLVAPEGAEESISALADHIDHIVDLGGGACVGFGFDFNDQILKYIPEEELKLVPRQCRDVLHGHGEIPLLLEELRRRGYREEQIDGIRGGNFMRVLRDALDA